MKTIYLHGTLGRRFGKVHRLCVRDPAEAVRALCASFKGFEQYVGPREYRVLKGKPERGVDLDQNELHIGFGGSNELHIVPILAVHKKGGLGKFLMGMLMVAAAFAIPAIAFGSMAAVGAGGGVSISLGVLGSFGIKFSTIALYGLAMSLGGLSQMLSPTPKTGKSGNKDVSFLMDGAPNLYEQGNCVPLALGLEVWAGSVTIGSAMVTYDMASQSTSTGSGWLAKAAFQELVDSDGNTTGTAIEGTTVFPSNTGGTGVPVNDNNAGVTVVPFESYSHSPSFSPDVDYFDSPIAIVL